jgi:hypothetical protein
VYANSQKIIIDSSSTGNLIYLPLDKLVRGDGRVDVDNENARLGENPAASQELQSSDDPNRDRRTRQ